MPLRQSIVMDGKITADCEIGLDTVQVSEFRAAKTDSFTVVF